MENNFRYWIMDGRARKDVDKALIIEVCNSVEEAQKSYAQNYSNHDYVIVDSITNTIIPTEKE
jgi:hypothetical protein